MAPDYSLLFKILLSLLFLDLAVAGVVFWVKSRSRAVYAVRVARMKRVDRAILDADSAGLRAEFDANPWDFLAQVRRTFDRVKPSPKSREVVRGFLEDLDLKAMAARRLRSPFLHKRIDAYCCLGLSTQESSASLLVEALGRERRSLGRLVLLNRIATHIAPLNVEKLIAAMLFGRPAARERETAALRPCAARIKTYFNEAEPPTDDIGLGLYLMATRAFPTEADFTKLSEIALEDSGALGAEAVRIMAERFPSDRFLTAFASRPEARFRTPVVRLLGLTVPPEGLSFFDPWFAEPAFREEAIAAAGSVLRLHPGSEAAFLANIEGPDDLRGSALSRAIEHRLPSLLYHADASLSYALRKLIAYLVDEERTGILVKALSSPLTPEVRSAFIGYLRELLVGRPSVASALARVLNADDSVSLGLPPPTPEPNRPPIPISFGDKIFLAILAVSGLAFFPLIFLAWRGQELSSLSLSEIVYRFLFDFQYLFAFYTIAVNSTYLILLVLSVYKLRAEAFLWARDLGRMLTTPGILPTISIIAPAYNEEKSIVESLQSLFSLAYPSYEVIVVNDGSKDDTLGALVKAFRLELVETGERGTLPTMPVYAVYRSASVPNLTVVDKANGGKADALNAGLNQASGDYICTIDADSILDPQSLLRMMFQLIATDGDVLAVGGNVFPVNGSSVEHGHLQEIGLSDLPLVRLQVIEYLRSFVGGRLGWTVLDGLLIISGAFGVFKRSAVMELGGYLAGSGSFRHQTVGEDMEIVVRLKRRDREKGRKGKVVYAFNANCWTEVPERWPLFARQRDRWHRGLLEVLCFHRSMAFRPLYGSASMIAMPYFFIFELVGPWIESLGYVMLAAILLLNLIDPIVPLTVFGIAVLFGALISLASFLLAELQILYFRNREFFKLLAMSLLESLGFRQLVGMMRTKANFEFFFVQKGWGAQERKGFARGTNA